MSNKRKKNTLSLDNKMKILKRLNEGVHGSRLAQDFNVTKSAISYIKSKKKDIMDAVANTYQEAKKKLYMVLNIRRWKSVFMSGF